LKLCKWCRERSRRILRMEGSCRFSPTFRGHYMTNSLQSLCGAAVIASTLLPCHAFAQAIPPLSPCTLDSRVPACDAVRGDRADGWRAQSRAEVMAPHAMVAASQPLAAQAGLQIMRGGRQRHRCSGRRSRGTQSGRADDDRRSRRSLCHHLCEEAG
jgi:hypothetical protein